MKIHKSVVSKKYILQQWEWNCFNKDSTTVQMFPKEEFSLDELTGLIDNHYAQKFFSTCQECGIAYPAMVEFEGAEGEEYLCQSCLKAMLELLS